MGPGGESELFQNFSLLRRVVGVDVNRDDDRDRKTGRNGDDKDDRNDGIGRWNKLSDLFLASYLPGSQDSILMMQELSTLRDSFY